jgi:hypothetical protein
VREREGVVSRGSAALLQLQLGIAVRAWPLIVIAWAIVLACSQPMQARAPMMQRPAMPPAMPQETPRAEIDRLAAKIDAQRAQMGLAEPPVLPQAATTNATPMGVTPSSHAADCHHGTSQTCVDSCTLSDDICSNAKRICDLASQLQGDGDAAAKCERGQQTCDAAHASCCACQQ